MTRNLQQEISSINFSKKVQYNKDDSRYKKILLRKYLEILQIAFYTIFVVINQN